MRRWLRRLALISSAAALVAVSGCAPGATASHSPTPSATAGATHTPPAVTPSATPAATPTAAPTSPPSPVATSVPVATPTPAAPFPWPANTPPPAPGRVLFGLLVEGTPAPGEMFSLYFQAPHVGQNEFELCGGLIACSPGPAHVYLWETPVNTPPGASPWAFQRQRPGQAPESVASGTVDVSQGGVVSATTGV